jgi:hypothetical protein
MNGRATRVPNRVGKVTSTLTDLIYIFSPSIAVVFSVAVSSDNTKCRVRGQTGDTFLDLFAKITNGEFFQASRFLGLCRVPAALI